ncbi:TetR/AcrR family transcriptional regulator [Mycolicibacterium mengxianglii]|uniref:TetR/AcrR family transcriptional regulator n=1 Tax=Mycolicibacterium mengxianglii TaxID=2736649 RepID=UPI001E50B573|nr:TetR/AcrR family transcriptional regulator [Mycolicibacterium mengxianglii]
MAATGDDVDAGSVDARILDAALELLRSGGPRAVTMQAVSESTGIAKTTIYRRHRDRRALLNDALQRLAQQPPIDPRASREQRLKWAIRQSIDVIANGIGVGGFAALLTNEDPEFSEVFRTMLVDYREQAVAAMAADAPDLDTIVDMVVGSYIAEFARNGTVDPSWGDRIFALLNR